MKFTDFLNHIQEGNIPNDPVLKTLYFDAKGQWNEAHDIAQNIISRDGDHLHAYIHRKEGDLWNARYWYQKAGVEYPSVSLDAEWKTLVTYFLNKIQ